MNPFLCPFKNPFGGLIAGGLSRPCFTDLVFWYNQKKLLDDLTGLKDKSTSKTHQAEPAGSVEFRGAQYATLASAITSVGDFTITIEGTINTSSGDYMILSDGAANNNYIYITSGGELTTKINGVAIQSSGLGILFDGSAYKIVVTRVNTTLTYDFNGTTDTDTCDAGDFVFDEISRSTSLEYVGNLWNITASDTTSGTLLDITMSYGEDANIISTVGPDATLVNGLTTDRVESALFGDDSFNDDGYVIADGTGTYTLGEMFPINLYPAEPGTVYAGRASKDANVYGWMVDLAGTETLTLAHLTGAETVTTKVGTSTVAVVAGGLTFTAGTVQYVLLSDGSELIFESSYESDQINIYNVDGTANHGLFVGAIIGSGGMWDTATIGASYLVANGFQVSGINVIPYPVGTKQYDGVFDAPADVFQIEQVEATLAVQEADASIWIDKTTGATKLVDPADLVMIADYAFVGNGAITLYSDDITGICLNKTRNYHNITPESLEMADTLEMLDTLEMIA